MSALSEFWHHKQYIFQEAISYLEKYAKNLTGEQKAKLVVDLMKQFHISTGGVWGPIIEEAVMAVIDYELAQIRQREEADKPTQIPPVQASIYGNIVVVPVPDDAELLTQGYKAGDVIWGYTSGHYFTITPPGSLPPMIATDGTRVDDVPLRRVGG